MVKILFNVFVCLVLFGCANTKKKNTPPPAVSAGKPPLVQNAPTSSGTDTTSVEAKITETEVEPTTATPVAVSPPLAPTKKPDRIGLILSGGAARAWGHVGVLRAIEKSKWPIQSVAGIEWGAVVAAVYARSLSSNEVEWELSKPQDLVSITKISEALFADKSVADLKVPFVCPSTNIYKKQTYLLNRGQLNKLVPFCVAQYGFGGPYQQSVAEMSDLSSLALHLKSTGATKVILIDVLSHSEQKPYLLPADSAENYLWTRSAIVMAKKHSEIDEVLRIDLSEFGIEDFDRRREIIAKAYEISYNAIHSLGKKLGL